MQTPSEHSGAILQAVFSVCLSSEDAAAALTAVGRIAGAAFAGEFQEYLSADRRPQFPSALKAAQSCVALIDCDRDPELALETMQRLQQIFPHRITLVAISSAHDAAFLLRAMRAGCSDVLSRPVEPDELTLALKRFQERHPVPSHAVQETGRMISFFGVKGGVGATTLAVHLATHLVRVHRKKVLLIDHKHELGHVALYLGIKDSVYYFEELIRNLDRLDKDLLEGFVVRHPSGIDVIPSPDTASVQNHNTAEAIERAMDYLRRQYDYVLVDSSTQYLDSVGALVAASDEICMICTPDIAALRDLARHIEHLSLTSGFVGKVRVIINRATSDDAVTAEQIEEAVRFPVSFTIPNSYAELMRAINAGEPVTPQHRGAFTQAVERWARALVVGPAIGAKLPKAKSFFNLWRRPQPSRT